MLSGDAADPRARERRDPGLLLARPRRANGEAGYADDAILLAKGIENFGGFFREADNTFRECAGHGSPHGEELSPDPVDNPVGKLAGACGSD